MTVEQILSVLRETPNRLATLTGAATPAQLLAVPEPGEWSVTEVLAHLRSCADMWGNAIETIVADEHATLKAVNPTTWIESTDYRELELLPFSTGARSWFRSAFTVSNPLAFALLTAPVSPRT